MSRKPTWISEILTSVYETSFSKETTIAVFLQAALGIPCSFQISVVALSIMSDGPTIGVMIFLANTLAKNCIPPRGQKIK